MPEEHAPPLRLRLGGRFSEQARLADAGLAGDEYDPWSRRVGVAKVRDELGQLAFPAYKWLATAGPGKWAI
jgi:hypothetical protein